MEYEERLGDLSPFTCPECHGALWEVSDGSMIRYRCHVGHAYTAETVLSARAAEVDRILETLLRSHQERAALVRRMAKHERSIQNDSLAAQFEARVKEYEHDAAVVRQLARHGPIDTDEGDFLRDEAAEEQEREER